MPTQPEDKWSYGASAKQGDDEPWPPPDDADSLASDFLGAGSAVPGSQSPGLPVDPLAADAPRLSTGRWMSPSLGAYDPADPAGTNPLDLSSPGDDDAYFEKYGYGADFGDGSFDADFDGISGSDDSDHFDDHLDDDELVAEGEARRNAIEWAVVLVGAVLLALVLRAVLLQAFWIPSPSMESTLLVKDRVLVNKVSYDLHDIHRGDVIVFRRTDAEIARNPELPRDVIKRVIGLGGETIMIEDDKVTIDGNELIEPYLDEGVTTSDFGPEVIPEGHVFVMGDNRELSLDSRFETGPIAHDRVVGRAFFLFWPLNRLGSL